MRLITAGLVASPMFVACGGSDTGASSTMNLSVVDGAVDTASEVVVEFTGVELQPRGGGNAITFNFSSPKQIDLLTLQNGNAATLLTGATVPAGDYDWIRLLLNVDSNNAVVGSY